MNFGLYVPPMGEYASARVLASLASDAEQAGWDGFFTWDHIASGWSDRVTDPWIAYAAIAMVTSRIRFGPLVTPLPRRRPWKVARETVSLDQLSGGRLIFGVGTGGGPEEFARLGEASDPKMLGAMLDEGLEVLLGLWSGETFSHHGHFYQVDEARFNPVPLQQPRIPVWVAGFWPNPAPFRRAARFDGVYPLNRDQEAFMTPEDYRQMLDLIARHRQVAGPFDVAHSGFSPGQDPDRAAEITARYAQAGVTWWLENVNPWRFGWDMHGPWPVEAMRERILQGPPRQG